MVASNFTQTDFRGYDDDVGLGSATAKAPANATWKQGTDQNFRVRFAFDGSSGDTGWVSARWELQYNLNEAGWNDVGPATSVVKVVVSGVPITDSIQLGTDANPLGDSIYSGAKADSLYIAGDYDENSGTATTDSLIDQLDWSEVEYCLQIVDADVVAGDIVKLRIKHADNSTQRAGEDLEDYDNTLALLRNFPQTVAPTTTALSAQTTSHVCNLPGSPQLGDLLMVHFSGGTITGTPFFGTTPSGWTKLWDNDHAFGVAGTFIKISDGTETTINIVTDIVTAGASHAYLITNWFGNLSGVEVGAAVEDVAAPTIDPPSLTTSWIAEENLWFAVAGGTNDDALVDIYPSGFTGGINTVSGGGIDAGCNIASARLQSPVVTVNPGVFDWSQLETAGANTIVVRPGGFSVIRRRLEDY